VSVPKGKRKEGKLEAQTLAYDFASLTDKICSNQKVFLKRNRWCTTTHLVRCVHEIAINIDLANETRLENPKRREFQDTALAKLIEANTVMEIAYRDNYNANSGHPTIPDGKIENWVRMLLELKSLIMKWRVSDTKRLSEPSNKGS
jgi:hypothetical protein